MFFAVDVELYHSSRAGGFNWTSVALLLYWGALIQLSFQPVLFMNSHFFMAKTAVAEPQNFEAAMAELDLLVEKMENGELALEASLSAYQRGTVLLKYCERVLADAQQRIQVLDGDALKDFKP